MTVPLVLQGAFESEQALRDMIVRRKVCFDHDPFYVKDGANRIVHIWFQLNLYAAFQDPAHLPTGDDPELREMVGELRRLCRVFFQSLDILKPCEHPEPPMHRVLYSPERRYRAEVCLQIPIFRSRTLRRETGPESRRAAGHGGMSASTVGGQAWKMGRSPRYERSAGGSV